MRSSNDFSERGASAVLIALSMVVLLGLVAMAVDGGLGFNERRQAQSGADFGAHGAVLLSSFPGANPECSGAGDSVQQAACKGAIEAIQAVEGNLPGRDLDWATCTDPNADPSWFSPQVPLTNGTYAPGGTLQTVDCLHFNSTTDQARVAVPTIDLDTTFARILGFDVIPVSAFAEAGGELPLEAKILPFALPANAGMHYDCLKTGPNPDWGVCKDLPAVGNFGYADIPVYGIESFGTLAEADNCNPNNTSLISNMVRGIDHWVEGHPNGTVSVGNPAYRDDSGSNTVDRTFVCPVWPGNANEINLQTGNVSSAFQTGMVWGFGPAERGRLWDDSGLQVRNPQGGNPATLINDDPLWSFLDGSGPAVCGAANDTPSMISCLNAWVPADGAIFKSGPPDGIRYAQRFAYAPHLWDDFGPQSWYLIEDLAPVFINTSYWGCSSGGGGGAAGSCAIIHTPGVTGPNSCSPVMQGSPPGSEAPDGTCGIPGGGNRSLNGVTSFILDKRMLPEDAQLPFTSTGPLINLALTE